MIKLPWYVLKAKFIVLIKNSPELFSFNLNVGPTQNQQHYILAKFPNLLEVVILWLYGFLKIIYSEVRRRDSP